MLIKGHRRPWQRRKEGGTEKGRSIEFAVSSLFVYRVKA